MKKILISVEHRTDEREDRMAAFYGDPKLSTAT